MVSRYRALLIATGFLAIMGSVTAVSITNTSVAPQEAWKGTSIDIQYECQTNGTVEQAYLLANSQNVNQQVSATIRNKTATLSYTPPKLGQYTGTLFCEAAVNGTRQNDTETVSFTYKDLTIQHLQLTQKPVYTDSTVELHFSAIVDKGSDTQEITNPGALDVTFGLPNWQRNDLYYSNGHWVLTGTADLTDKTYKPQLSVETENHTATETLTIDAKSPLRAEVSNLPAGVTPGSTVTMTIDASYRSNPVPLSNLSVTATVSGKNADTETDGGNIVVDIPNTVSGETTEMTIELVHDSGHTYTVDRTVNVLYRFTGELTNVDGKKLTGRMTLSNSDTTRKDVFNDGTYNLYAPRGTYNITLTDIEGLELFHLQDVPVTSSLQNALRIDNPNAIGITGLNEFGGVALETISSYNDAIVRVAYNPKKAKAEDNILLFHCGEYNLDSRYCSGSWDTVDATIDTVRNYMTTKTKELGAFVTARRQSLQLAANMKDSYRIKNDIALQGTVKNENGDPISDATVTATINKNKAETTTGDRGGFSFTVPAPSQEGDYTLSLSAEKGLYRTAEQEQQVNITADRSLTIKVPENLDATAGETAQYDITIRNTGQVPLQQLQPAVTVQCDTCNVSYTPKTLPELDVFDTATVGMTIEPGEEHAGDLLTGEITIGNEGVEKTESFAISVSQSTTRQSNTETAADESLTGHVTANIDAMKTAVPAIDLSLLNILSILIAAAVFGYFKFQDFRGAANTDTTDTSNRLETLKEEAMNAVTIVDDAQKPEGNDEAAELSDPDTEETAEADSAPDADDSEEAEESQDSDHGVYECDRCSDEFDTETGLKIHNVNAHGD